MFRFMFFVLLTIFGSVGALAQQTDCKEKGHKKLKVVPTPKKVAPKKPSPVFTPAPKPVATPAPAPKTEPCCKKDGGESAASAGATTGNQVVNISMAPARQEPKYRVLVRTRIKRVTEKVEIYKPNRLLFLVGQTKTKLSVESDNCCNLTANNKNEPDFGVAYIRDFGDMSASIMGTVNKSVYLGLGLNF